ncbi:MAG: serine/threonine-protein kinase [bacterium]
MSSSQAFQFGRYEVIGEIGRGSMGVVYKARDPAIGRLVAVKSIPETFGLEEGKREEFIKRLRQEAMTAGRLQHPNVVIIYDVGETEQGPFIAMEYLDGVSLRDVVTAGKKISMGQLVEIISQVAEGLDYAHQKAIIHRDVKPANIMIVADNRVKIMDLGIARFPMSELTKEGKLVGSPSYMSPEQLSGKPIDGRSDLFSLAVCIYQLMSFKKPFPGESVNEICYKIVHEDYVPICDNVNDLPPEFEDFMMIALSKNPDERFQSGAEMVEALSIIAGRSSGEGRQEEGTGSDVFREGVEEQAAAFENSYDSNPNLSHSSNIDDIFKELTHTSRSVDLRGSRPAKGWKWLVIAGAAAAAGIVGLVIWILAKGG